MNNCYYCGQIATKTKFANTYGYSCKKCENEPFIEYLEDKLVFYSFKFYSDFLKSSCYFQCCQYDIAGKYLSTIYMGNYRSIKCDFFIF